MKGGNGMKDSANKKVWKGGMRKENNNLVKNKVGAPFNAKKDSFKKK